MSTWRDLERELDAWAEAGRDATFWWRDDDAVAPGPALDRLLDLAARHDLPVTLAVIPAHSTSALALRLEGEEPATPVQHGFAHKNHAPPDEKKMELGPHRPAELMCEELARGAAVMGALFGAGALPVLVPPWNRIDPALIETLPELGFAGLSTYGPRPATPTAAGLSQVNTHVDIMRWKEPRGFRGEENTLAVLLCHLRARRTAEAGGGALDPLEPTGLMSHHLVHDDAAWRFLDGLLAVLARHRAARVMDAAEAFGLSP